MIHLVRVRSRHYIQAILGWWEKGYLLSILGEITGFYRDYIGIMKMTCKLLLRA